MARGAASSASSPAAEAAVLPASDADFRHTPAPNQPGADANARGAVAASPGTGSSWVEPGGSDARRQDRSAGGVDPRHPHLFHLSDTTADAYDGGSLQGCHGGNWPMLGGQFAASYIARLEPGAFREPHWHPSAWELNFVVRGRVRWTFVGPQSSQDSFEAGEGDLIFAPQGHFHYFENASDTEELVVLVVFNASAEEPADDIGIAQSLSAMPPEVLAGAFGVDPSVFRDLPKRGGRVVIGRRRGG